MTMKRPARQSSVLVMMEVEIHMRYQHEGCFDSTKKPANPCQNARDSEPSPFSTFYPLRIASYISAPIRNAQFSTSQPHLGMPNYNQQTYPSIKIHGNPHRLMIVQPSLHSCPTKPPNLISYICDLPYLHQLPLFFYLKKGSRKLKRSLPLIFSS
jgi:hypothetical protein